MTKFPLTWDEATYKHFMILLKQYREWQAQQHAERNTQRG